MRILTILAALILAASATAHAGLTTHRVPWEECKETVEKKAKSNPSSRVVKDTDSKYQVQMLLTANSMVQFTCVRDINALHILTHP